MPTKRKKSSPLTGSYKKQHGFHHKQNGKYLKVYWPYIPLLVFVISGIAASISILHYRPSLAILNDGTVASLAPKITNYYVLGIAVITLIAMYLVIKHGLIIKKMVLQTEKVVINHPLLDVILVIFIVGIAILNQVA